jgi:hypothetical protein
MMLASLHRRRYAVRRAFMAFGLGTALCGSIALVSVYCVRRSWEVTTMHDFSLKLSQVINGLTLPYRGTDAVTQAHTRDADATKDNRDLFTHLADEDPTNAEYYAEVAQRLGTADAPAKPQSDNDR